MRRRANADGSGPGDPAVRRARAVVGFYGDPTVTWSIGLEVALTGSLEADRVAARARDLVVAFPHLGTAAAPVVHPSSERAAVLREFLDTSYGDRDALVRVGVDEQAGRLTVAAHHGAVDGLGLVGVAAELLGLPLGTSAGGLSPSTLRRAGFLGGSLRRLGEAVVSPPERFASTARGAARGDWCGSVDAQLRRVRTTDLAWASAVALAAWNGREVTSGRPVVAVGLSRRSGRAPLAPTRDTAYARLRARGVGTTTEMRDLAAATPVEPDFPERRAGGVGPAVARLLSARLGSSVLVSNLGRLTGAGDVAGARFWPAPAGPAGVAFGLVSAGDLTSITARVRRGWFREEDAQDLAGLVAAELSAGQ